MCRDTYTGTRALEQRHFSRSSGRMAMHEELGWSGALQQLPSQSQSCAMAGDVCWGMNPALDATLPKGAEGVKGAGKQTRVVASPTSSCALLLISTALGKQQ